MDVGVFVPVGAANANADFLRLLGPAVEERGFESIWLAEHVVLFDEYESQYPYATSGRFPGGGDTGLVEPLMGLTYLAAVTEQVRLGTGICLVPQRNPVYTAKQVADLDVMSGGRVDFGIGIGWLREEFEALNVPFEKRGKRTDEYLQVMRSLWTEDTSAFSGELYDLRPCRLYPKPTQKPHPPIHVGGESDAAMRRAARFGQGWFTFNRLPADLPSALSTLDEQLAAVGRSRDDDDFVVSVCPYLHRVTPAMMGEYAALGIDRVILVCFAFARDDLLTTLDSLVNDAMGTL